MNRKYFKPDDGNVYQLGLRFGTGCNVEGVSAFGHPAGFATWVFYIHRGNDQCYCHKLFVYISSQAELGHGIRRTPRLGWRHPLLFAD